MDKPPASSFRMLTKEDITLLLADRSTKNQMQIIGKLAEQYTHEGAGALNEEQAQIAQDIFKILIDRGDEVVRAMLSMHLSQTERLPRNIARKMAHDKSSEVANPMLQYSPVLDDEDLAEVITSLVHTSQLVAIAKRKTVSETLSELLVGTSLEPVATALIQNEGSNIPIGSYQDLVRMHNGDAEVMQALLERNAVPIPIVELAIDQLAPQVRTKLTHIMGDLTTLRQQRRASMQELEENTLKMMRFRSNDKDLMSLIKQLSRDKRLAPFSAIATANLSMFVSSMSRILHIPIRNMELLISDDQGLAIAYHRAALPDSLMEATFLAIRALQAIEQDQQNGVADTDIAITHVMARMRSMAENKPVRGLEELFSIMQYYHY